MSTERAGEHVPSRARKIIQFPLTRVIIALVLVVGAVQGIQLVLNPLGRYLFAQDDLPKLWLVIIWMLTISIAYLAYYAHVRFIEKRLLTELAWSGALTELGRGCAVGTGLFVGVIVILWGLHQYHVIAVSGIAFIIIPFFHYVYTAVYEELVFRGILFRIIEENLGSWLALVFSGLLFGFAHSTVPNATLYSNLAIALLGGVIFSAAYMYTRRLWFAFGIHFAWNFTQVGIFGLAVSRIDGKGLLESEITGSKFSAGGCFGIETSIVTFIIVLSAGLYFLWRSKKQGHFIQPFWRIKK